MPCIRHRHLNRYWSTTGTSDTQDLAFICYKSLKDKLKLFYLFQPPCQRILKTIRNTRLHGKCNLTKLAKRYKPRTGFEHVQCHLPGTELPSKDQKRIYSNEAICWCNSYGSFMCLQMQYFTFSLKSHWNSYFHSSADGWLNVAVQISLWFFLRFPFDGHILEMSLQCVSF